MDDNKKITASAILILGAFGAMGVAGGQTPSEYLTLPAYVVGIAIMTGFALEATGNVRKLIRADWVAIIALYGLTLTEFLFPQPEFNDRMDIETTERALFLFTLGFVSLVVGRHLWKSEKVGFLEIGNLSTSLLVKMFFVVVICAFAAELIAVSGNVISMTEFQMGPRFSQPWQRARFGGWYSLITELSLFKLAIAPITGVLINQRKQISTGMLALIVFIGFYTLFFIFCSGTRNVLAGCIAGFSATYLLTSPKLGIKRLAVVGMLSAAIFLPASVYMLEFRGIGLTRWWNGSYAMRETIFVDYNLWAIGTLGSVFPEQYPFTGIELYWVAITKPIPRAIWPGKPEGLPVTIEDALGAEGLTISTTFIGESYMAFGELGIIATGLLIGFACSWWNHQGARMPTGYGQLIYASGFAAIAIGMRSIMFITTNMLPAIGLIVLGIWIKKLYSNQMAKRSLPPQNMGPNMPPGLPNGIPPNGIPPNVRPRLSSPSNIPNANPNTNIEKSSTSAPATSSKTSEKQGVSAPKTNPPAKDKKD